MIAETRLRATSVDKGGVGGGDDTALATGSKTREARAINSARILETRGAEGRRREMGHWTTEPASATINEPTPANPRVDHWAPRPPFAFAAV